MESKINRITDILGRDNDIITTIMSTEQISWTLSKRIKRFAPHCRANLGVK